MDMPIVDVEGYEAQQLGNYDMPAVFSDDDGSAQKKRSQVLESTCLGMLAQSSIPNSSPALDCASFGLTHHHH